MEHLKVLYYFLSFLTGVFSFGIGLIVYLKTKHQTIKHYLIFLFTIIMISFTWIFSAYNSVLETDYRSAIYMIRIIIESISFNVLKWTFPLIIHSLFKVPYAKKANIFFFILGLSASIYFVIYYFFIFENRTGPGRTFLHYYIQSAFIFFAVLIYILITGLFFYKKQERPITREIRFKVLIMVFCFIPLFILDNFTGIHEKYIILTPLVIIIMNGLSLHLALKYFFFASRENRPGLIPDQTFFNSFDISQREKEICLLLLEGHSYQKIADLAFISKSTVKTHINKLYRKTGVTGKEELIDLIKSSSRHEQ